MCVAEVHMPAETPILYLMQPKNDTPIVFSLNLNKQDKLGKHFNVVLYFRAI